MASVFELFVLGTTAFWICTAVLVVSLMLMVEAWDSGSAATVTVVLALIIIGHANHVSWWSLLRDNALWLALGTLLWLALGTAWTFFKWWEFVQRRFIDYPTSRPDVRYETPRLLRWMVYWPFSLGGWVLTDPIQRLARIIIRHISGKLDTITDHVYGSRPN